MSIGEKAAFRSALRNAIQRFTAEETRLRSEYAGELREGTTTIEDILERPTRRFLIDPLLRALDWDPDVPAQIGEEVRSRNRDTNEALFFDYFGRAANSTPALLVEAKRVNAELPRSPREPISNSAEIARIISRELGILKSKTGRRELLAVWSEWLTDLITYVRSLSTEDQRKLARVVITAGNWLIVFKSPFDVFVEAGTPDPELIVCFQSFDEIEQCADEIFDLLGRGRLVDTLPLTMTLGEALAVLPPESIQSIYRGVIVTTNIVGPVRGTYPIRLVHPVVVLSTATREYAVANYGGKPVTEPTESDGLPTFIAELAARGNAFQEEVLQCFGRRDLAPLPVSAYPRRALAFARTGQHSPIPGSTADQLQASQHAVRRLALSTGERGAGPELLVVTGDMWFYKLAAAAGSPCDLHFWPKAKAIGQAGAVPSFGPLATSYTSSGDPQHCEHNALHGIRKERCHLESIESHMCCRACVFHSDCWTANDLARLPCANRPSPFGPSKSDPECATQFISGHPSV